jgi:hypothetical protein
MQQQNEGCVSIYMPTARAGEETAEGPIRLKNAVKEAEKQLVELGWRAADARTLLKPADELIHDDLFWQYQSDGLALFFDPRQMRYFRVPLDFSELSLAGDRFHLKPLLPLFSAEGHFYLLAVSQNQVRLFQATRHRIHDVALKKIPSSLAEILRADDPESQLQFHSRTGESAGGGQRRAIFHGQGVGIDDSKSNLMRFFQAIDNGLCEILSEERAPLVFAGVEHLFGHFRKANHYRHLLDEFIEGNPDQKRAEELHAEAWKLVEPVFLKKQEETVGLYHELANRQSEKVSSDIREIVPAANQGRTDSLFVLADAHQWGRFDPETDQVKLTESAEPGCEDLLDLATLHTFLKGENVFLVEKETMPDDAPVAAVFRY